MRVKKKYSLVNLDTDPMQVDRGRRSNTPEEQKRRFLRGLTFVGVGLVLAVVALVIIITVISDVGNSGKRVEEKKKDEDEEIVYSEKDSLTVLIAVTDDEKINAEHFILMRIDPMCYEMEKYGYGVCFMSLPTDLSVGENGNTLSEEYTIGGTAQCALDLQNISSSRKISTATINFKSLSKLVDNVKGLKMVVEYDINYESPKGDRNINIAAGNREFNGSEAARVLYFPDWPGGKEEHDLMFCRAFASIANKLICRTNSGYLDYYFNRITNAVTTNVSAGQYQEIKKALYNFALDHDGTEDMTKIFLCQTEYDETGAKRLSESGEQAMRTLFGEHE